MLEGTVYVPVDQYRLPVDPSTRAFDLEFLIYEVCILSDEGLSTPGHHPKKIDFDVAEGRI